MASILSRGRWVKTKMDKASKLAPPHLRWNPRWEMKRYCGKFKEKQFFLDNGQKPTLVIFCHFWDQHVAEIEITYCEMNSFLKFLFIRLNTKFDSNKWKYTGIQNWWWWYEYSCQRLSICWWYNKCCKKNLMYHIFWMWWICMGQFLGTVKREKDSWIGNGS